MQMDAGLDTGPMLLAARCRSAPTTPPPRLHDRLAALGARWSCRRCTRAGGRPAAAHAAAGRGRDLRRTRSTRPRRRSTGAAGGVIERRVRAFDPFPGASFLLDGETVKLWRAAFQVACGDGVLELLEVQRTGRPARAGAPTSCAAVRPGAGTLRRRPGWTGPLQRRRGSSRLRRVGR
jgi:methionyl-tRNA formyltransferase